MDRRSRVNTQCVGRRPALQLELLTATAMIGVTSAHVRDGDLAPLHQVVRQDDPRQQVADQQQQVEEQLAAGDVEALGDVGSVRSKRSTSGIRSRTRRMTQRKTSSERRQRLAGSWCPRSGAAMASRRDQAEQRLDRPAAEVRAAGRRSG